MVKYFDPEIFLEIAKKLKNNSSFDEQGRIITAIGSFYYAAFLKASIKLQSLGYSFQDDSRIHADVREALQDRKKSNIASKLEKLFNLRVKADYKLYAQVNNSDYETSLYLSENIVNLIDQL